MYSTQKKYTFIAALIMSFIIGGALFGMEEVKTTNPAVFEELPLELNRSILLQWLETILGYNYKISSTFLELEGECNSLISTYNPDLVLIGTWRDVFLYNIRTGKTEKQFANYSIQHIAVSIESSKVALLQGKEIVLWDFSTEEKNVIFKADEALRLVALSYDGNSILAVSDQNVYLYDSSTKNLVKKFKLGTKAAICSIAFNRKSNKILIATKNGEIILWDLQGEKLAAHMECLPIKCALLSPDERSIIAAGEQGIALFDAHTGSMRITNSDIKNILSLGCSPDGNTLIAGSSDKKVYIIDFKTAKVLTTLKHSGRLRNTLSSDSGITGICFTSDGNNIISASRLGKICIHRRLNQEDNAWIQTRKETALELYLQLLGKPKQEALSISRAQTTNFYEQLPFSVVPTTSYYQQLKNISKDKAFLIFVIFAIILGYNL